MNLYLFINNCFSQFFLIILDFNSIKVGRLKFYVDSFEESGKESDEKIDFKKKLELNHLGKFYLLTTSDQNNRILEHEAHLPKIQRKSNCTNSDTIWRLTI